MNEEYDRIIEECLDELMGVKAPIADYQAAMAKLIDDAKMQLQASVEMDGDHR